MTLLHESAPLARAWADECCDAACASLHGVWQDLRRFSLVSTPDRHAAFFARELAGARRVLVSGTADFAIVEILTDTCPDADVVVLDRCETPLRLCAWYADRRGNAIRCVRADALTWTEGTYDRIVTHSFLPFFSPEQRVALWRRWGTMLAPGGRIVTTNRLDPRPEVGPVGFDDAQRATLLAAVRAVTASLAPSESAEILRRAEVYATATERWPLRSIDDVHALAASAGLRATVTPVDLPGAPTGPGTRQQATYVEVVATRA